MNMKAQVAFEFMVMVMVLLAFIIPIWAYVSNVQQSAIQELSASYAKNAINNIADTANLLYSQGPPAKAALKIYIPEGIENVNITGSNIMFTMSATGNTLSAVSMAPLNGTLPMQTGTYFIILEATTDFVQVGVE